MQLTDILLDPMKLLVACDIKKNHNVADFGCGPGIFSIPLAQLASDGTVYCFDVLSSALDAVENRAYVMGLNNIVTKKSNLEQINGTGLKEGSVQHVVMRKVVLQNDDKKALFTEAYRVLSQNSNLLVVGLNDRAVQGFGMEYNVSADMIQQFAQQVGFQKGRVVDAGSYHYAFIFVK